MERGIRGEGRWFCEIVMIVKTLTATEKVGIFSLTSRLREVAIPPKIYPLE